MKYYIVAGEASGDLHGSNLMKEIKNLDKKAEFRIWGGDLMRAQGGVLVSHYKERAFMGFVEVLANIGKVMGFMKQCKEDIERYRPDALILIDYPGFNLRIAEFAKKRGMKVFYYISPQVWAWKQSRVKDIKKYVDRMFVILPFEKDFYRKWDYEVDFVGHPLLDAVGSFHKAADFRARNFLDRRPVIALLPGSRKQEIQKLLPLMVSMAERFEDYQFVVGGAPSVPEEFYREIIGNRPVGLVLNQTYDLLMESSAALVTSGTATLETAIFGVPEVVCYKGSKISYWIARRLVDVKFISLVNLIMDREVVKELIQDDFNAESLERELNKIMQPEHREKLKSEYDELRRVLGQAGASEKTARLIVGAMK